MFIYNLLSFDYVLKVLFIIFIFFIIILGEMFYYYYRFKNEEIGILNLNLFGFKKCVFYFFLNDFRGNVNRGFGF